MTARRGELVAGNGLRGMRERLRQYGGQLQLDTGQGTGFGLSLRLPAASDDPLLPAPAIPAEITTSSGDTA